MILGRKVLDILDLRDKLLILCFIGWTRLNIMRGNNDLPKITPPTDMS